MRRCYLLRNTVALAIILSSSTPFSASAEWNGNSNDSLAPGNLQVSLLAAFSVAPSGVYVTFTTAPWEPSCNNETGLAYYKLDGAPEDVSKMFALLQGAKLSGMRVKVYRPDAADKRCSGGSPTGYPIITAVSLG